MKHHRKAHELCCDICWVYDTIPINHYCWLSTSSKSEALPDQKCHHAGRTARIHSFFAPLFALQSTHWLLTSTNARTKMSAPKKTYVLHQYLHQMFKVYIPTIHLLWTCLNTHYLFISKVIPSITIIGSSCGTTSAPKKRNFPSSAQLQRRPSAPLEKIHHHLRSIYPHVTYRFREQKYRTSVVMGALLFWRCFISFPQEISVMIFLFQMAIIQGMRWPW